MRTLLDDIFESLFPISAVAANDADQSAPLEAPPVPTTNKLEAAGLRVAYFRRNDDDYGPARDTVVVYRPREDNKHTIEVATAVCSALDTFDKKTGRNLAFRRFQARQTVKLPPKNTGPQGDWHLLNEYFG